jgi:short subunit dehydrogenase-like uncharacterized protein
MEPAVLIYGANGYTGRLIAGSAGRHGLRPILAGRRAAAIAPLARALDLEHRVFDLRQVRDVLAGVAGTGVVLNCAGPFIHTFDVLSRACIDSGSHYLDITGEIDVLEALAARSAEAAAAGVMLLPGVGFDVVPSDCLAAYVVRRLPGTARLLLGFTASGTGVSRGTARTMVEHMHRGGRVRRGGEIIEVPAAWKMRDIDFGDGPRRAVTFPWGDVATAWHSTGVADVEVYRRASRPLLRALGLADRFRWLLRSRVVRAAARGLIRTRPRGPGERARHTGSSVIWCRAEDEAGRAAEARLHGPEPYQLTVEAALRIVRRAMERPAPPGFQTPSSAYGPDLALEIPGVRRVDVL